MIVASSRFFAFVRDTRCGLAGGKPTARGASAAIHNAMTRDAINQQQRFDHCDGLRRAHTQRRQTDAAPIGDKK
ncbi:MAG: hypothetical protein ACREP0_10325 [Rhodanobacteraceae bacterium]